MMEKWPLTARFRRAVNKVRFLLTFNLHNWLSTALLGGSIGTSRRLCFGNRSGLSLCMEEDDDGSSEYGSCSGSLTGSTSLQRTTSRCSSYDPEFDVDEKAEMFIANFHRQLQIERQISLELKYQTVNSFGSRSP